MLILKNDEKFLLAVTHIYEMMKFDEVFHNKISDELFHMERKKKVWCNMRDK